MPIFLDHKKGPTLEKKGTRQQKLSWDAKDWSTRHYLEADLQKFILTELNQLDGVYARAVKKGNVIGIPDLICCVKGRYLAMELKIDSDPTIQQGIELDAVRQSGGVAGIVKCWKDALMLLREAGYPVPKSMVTDRIL